MHFSRLMPLLLVMALSACATAPMTTSQQEVRMQVEMTMAAFVAMQPEGLKAGLAEDVVAYEIDLEGKPVRLGSRDDAMRYAEDMFAQVKQMRASLQLDLHAIDCHANTILAYCTVEADVKALMADGSTMVQPSHISVVLRRDADGWKWVHWHTSLSVLAAP